MLSEMVDSLLAWADSPDTPAAIEEEIVMKSAFLQPLHVMTATLPAAP